MTRILLIDDEEHIRQLYGEELSEEGYEIVTAASGHDLLRKIDLLQPDVVILDIRLVGYDGLELLQDIRGQHRELPVIICTAYDTYKRDPKALDAHEILSRGIKSKTLSQFSNLPVPAVE